ncbi:hypothetical protein DH2020_024419 [Rehmannia glutinosa]|uniref:Uncharacterized protein n=1 Tax=Rehmannia glutinosa TaxID=99300 RepID=A0ABR0W6N4_REHGL
MGTHPSQCHPNRLVVDYKKCQKVIRYIPRSIRSAFARAQTPSSPPLDDQRYNHSTFMAVFGSGASILTFPPPVAYHRHLHFSPSTLRSRHLSGNTKLILKASISRDGMESSNSNDDASYQAGTRVVAMYLTPPANLSLAFLRLPHIRANRTGLSFYGSHVLSWRMIECSQDDSAESSNASKSEVIPEDQNSASDNSIGSIENKPFGNGSSFLSKLGILLGVAAVITLVSVGLKPPSLETSSGIHFLLDSSSSSTLAAPASAFSFRAFGYRVVLPEYAPGWIYFWLLMAAGCGLFISEEALNIWVGISLARLLSLDGTWQSLVDSFSRNAPYMISTVVWVYWGVCISDMIPFYLGKFFRQSGASDDICSKLGIGKEKAMQLTRAVQRYGNLIGFVSSTEILNHACPLSHYCGRYVERFSLGDISPECFFAGVCCGGLVTLPLQLAIGFLLRERPVFALATVATVVGIWTVFPYAVAALTALFLYLRRRYST